jgi:hypothetical protein
VEKLSWENRLKIFHFTSKKYLSEFSHFPVTSFNFPFYRFDIPITLPLICYTPYMLENFPTISFNFLLKSSEKSLPFCFSFKWHKIPIFIPHFSAFSFRQRCSKIQTVQRIFFITEVFNEKKILCKKVESIELDTFVEIDWCAKFNKRKRIRAILLTKILHHAQKAVGVKVVGKI